MADDKKWTSEEMEVISQNAKALLESEEGVAALARCASSMLREFLRLGTRRLPPRASRIQDLDDQVRNQAQDVIVGDTILPRGL